MDLISRQAAIDALNKIFPADPMKNDYTQGIATGSVLAIEYLKALPPEQPEPLTNKELSIFLAAMCKEEKVCKEVDMRYPDEPYEDSLMWVCNEIIRKVTSALWT